MPASRLSLYIQATRPAFLSVSALGCFLGAAITYANTGSVHLVAILIATLIAVIGQASANVINDIVDAVNGTDERNTSRISPFTGGSRMIQDQVLSLAQVRNLAIITVGLCILAGALLLHLMRAWHLVWIGVAGLFIGWAYSAKPLALMSRGVLGEVAIAAVWALIVIGTTLLETPLMSTSAWLLGLGYGLMVANILFANQIPDIAADQSVGKMTLAVTTPAHQLWCWYAAMALSAYGLILVAISINAVSVYALLGFIGLPISTQAIKNLIGIAPDQIGNPHSAHRQRMVAAIRQTILAAHLYGLGLAVGLILSARYSIPG